MTTADVHALVSSSAKRTAAVSKVSPSPFSSATRRAAAAPRRRPGGLPGSARSTGDFANYKTFLGQLATALHAKGKRLSVSTLPAMTEVTPLFYDRLSGGGRHLGADDVVIMAYDEEFDTASGARCLPISPYDWLKKVTGTRRARSPTPTA
ncbi:hypothetical protein ACRAWF_06125 [Streptomyces sp. L7]